ncbi:MULTISPECIES: LytTR family DNA-binding domain-containing protein [Hyphobacterium]|uniref:LytTR family DNA-binding domain-containing protein n=1 Tax=Hyphobacterium vulgare TaxID=1736751 RepID=A0ABV7A0R2_9PROT
MRFLVLVLFWLIAADADAQGVNHDQPVMVCPAEAGDTVPPDFGRAGCRSVPLQAVDPQGRALWVRLSVTVAPELIETGGPLGLFISGKASSEIWIGGRRIGANGVPAATPEAEVPGRIDAVIFLPPGTLSAGENEIVLSLSAQHGLVRLNYPLQHIGVYAYQDPTSFILAAYWPALVTLGLFGAGFVVFGVLAIRGDDREGSALMALLPLAAAGQLVAETLRGFWSYPYPVQDFRLIAITGFAVVFGGALIALVSLRTTRMSPIRRALVTGGTLVVTLLAVGLAGAFDTKTALALVIPAFAGITLSAWNALSGRRSAWIWAAALSTFVFAYLLPDGLFLDRHFYFVVAGLLLALFFLHAISLVRERRQRRAEEARARKLETALDLARERARPSDLAIAAPGRMEKVSTARISHLSGAGDYVEIHTDDGRTLLHGGSLSALEETLPATFLRVHRSHIVNTLFVTALEREASGTGLLTLSTGTVIPVSRRILPAVRQALGVVAGAP